MTRRETGVPWIDVFKFVICQLNSKDDVGSPSTLTAKGEVQGCGWQVQGLWCVLSALCAFGMGCSCVLFGHSFVFLESGPFPFFISLAHMCKSACMLKYTHCSLTQLVAKGLFSRLLHRGQTFPGAAIVWWKNQEQCLIRGRTDFAMNFIWPTSSYGMDIYTSQIVKDCKTRTFTFKIIRVLMIKQGVLGQ